MIDVVVKLKKMVLSNNLKNIKILVWILIINF